MSEEALFLKRFYDNFTKMHRDFNDAVIEGNHDEAIKMGEEMIRMLLNILKEKIVSKLTNPITLQIVDDIIKYYERELSYVKGIKEASSSIPLLYSYQAKERALETLARDVEELFSLVLGALLILSEAAYILQKKEEENLRGYI
ncbi:MAG: hypothetical protein J7L38_02380 [Thermoproteales archaeon]|nr:hypothetical protein [Thermoproteales archaeon]RLE67249.1 MAG: hypothetical protein DRJ47_00030 [Thermoprotei archaeon]